MDSNQPQMAGAGPLIWGEDIDMAHLQRAIRAEVAGILSRLNELVFNPHSTSVKHLPDIAVIQEDLDRTLQNINLCIKQGSDWESDTFGCTQEQMANWRGLVANTLVDLQTHDSARRAASMSMKSSNNSHVKIDWPKQINAQTWQLYYKTWLQEKDMFPGDWHRRQHLMGALSSEDKAYFVSATDPDDIIHGLMRLYGTETDFVLRKLKELNSLTKPHPANLKHIINNLCILRENIKFIRDHN